MEILITIAIILILCVISGISISTILSGVLLLTLLSAVLILLFFITCVVNLIASKKITVRFDRIDRENEKSFERAYYSDGENCYPNAFPYEKLLKSVLYTPGSETKVRLCRKKNKVFDRMSLFIVAAGILLSGMSVFAISVHILELL